MFTDNVEAHISDVQRIVQSGNPEPTEPTVRAPGFERATAGSTDAYEWDATDLQVLETQYQHAGSV